MELKNIALVTVMYVTAIWMLLHGIRGFQTGVIIETRKSSPIKDYYYRGDLGFYVNVFLYIVGGTGMIGFTSWLLMTDLGYW
ncbi:hypothetical protein FP388_19930 [Citrobacter europaeus]|jgi:hypothetical protein|nr:hypothetical protein MC47_003985 [Citrobacter freundii]MBY1059024.1 hypothetical protein [Citrobacter europaeus]ROW34299.1 hypothetical protein C3454_21715 [Citrobacter europaeus]